MTCDSRSVLGKIAGSPSAAMCLLISFVDNLAIALVIPLLPGLAAAAGAEPGRWVWVLAVNGVVLTLCPFVWGRVITGDNAGKVIALTLTVKAFCTVTLLLTWLPWQWLLVNRAISGAMSGTSLATQLWLVNRAADSQGRARAIADLSVACSIGIGAGALLAVPILANSEAIGSPASPAGGMIVGVFLILIVLAASAHLTLVKAERVEVRHRSDGFEADGPIAPFAPPARFDLDALAVVTVNTLSRTSVFAFPILILLTAEQDGRLSAAFATLLISLLAFLEIPSQFIVPRMIVGLGYRRASLALLLLVSIGLFIPSYVLSEFSTTLSAVIVALSGGALQSVLSVYLTEMEDDRVARWLGAAQGMAGAARAVAPLFAVALFAHGVEAAFLAIGLLSLIGIPFVAGVLKRAHV